MVEDIPDLPGDEDARRALEVALAGGHHLLLVGPAGIHQGRLADVSTSWSSRKDFVEFLTIPAYDLLGTT